MTLQNGQAAPEKTNSDFGEKLRVLGRMTITGAGVAISIFGLLGVLNADQVKEATPVIQDIIADAQKLASDLYALWGIVGVSLIIAAGKLGFGASTLASKLKSITTNKNVTIPEGSVIIVPKSVADAVPSDKVVSS